MSINTPVLLMIIVLVPMLYYLLAAPSFLFVRMDIPIVAFLFRKMLVAYFVVLIAAAALAMGVSLLGHRGAQALVFAAVAGAALLWRRAVLRRIEAAMALLPPEVGAANPALAPRLRRLHLVTLAANAAQTAAFLALFLPLTAPS